MNKTKLIFFAFWVVYWLLPSMAGAKDVLVYEEGAARILGLLPDPWQEMSAEERQVYLQHNGGIVQSAGRVLNAFHRPTDSDGIEPVIFVFYSAEGQKVTEDQREKIYAWFEKNKAIACLVAPSTVKSMSLDNIEYLHGRDTILFATTLEVEGRQLHGMSGIVFLDWGYLNIVGFENNGEKRYQSDFDSFIKTLSISQGLKHSAALERGNILPWCIAHWQQIVGVLLFCLVYGIVFLTREKRLTR